MQNAKTNHPTASNGILKEQQKFKIVLKHGNSETIKKGLYMICNKCKSEMLPEYDYTNSVRVLVCSNPSCLNREYPDYPRRNGNQELCYICGELFSFEKDELGIVCRKCKNKIRKNREHRQGKRRRDNLQYAV
jgi:ssDNA-binding Zn-finger/Zn-ribbon topoisomerase 1